MVYEAVEKLSSDFPVQRICEVLKVSRSAYYNYKNGSTYVLSEHKATVARKIKRVFDRHKRRYGTRRIKEELRDEGDTVGRFQIRNRMKEMNLVAIQPRSFVPRTTKGNPDLDRSPNLLLDEENLPDKPDEVIVGDITYLPNVEAGYDKWLYLASWMDLYSRYITGWHVDRHMEEDLVIEALNQLIRHREPSEGYIVHSDGGGQYKSNEFKLVLARHDFRQSMTREGNVYDNAFAESLFSRFKAELLDGGIFYGLEDARLRVFEYIEGYYNTIRKHSSIGYLSPKQFEEQQGKE